MNQAFLLVVFISILFLHSLHSQSFQTGYVVTSSFDTLFGEIALEFVEQDQQRLLFRTDKKGEVEIFSPTDLTAFSKNDIVYHSISLSYTHPDEEVVALKAFAELLLEGKISLYRFQTIKMRKVFLIQHEDNQIRELVNTGKKLKTIGDRQYQMEDRRYIATLESILSSCSGLEKEIETVTYHAPPLRNLLIQWHECNNHSFVVPNKSSSGLSLQLSGIRLAGSINQQNFDDEGWINSRAIPGLELATDLYFKGLSLWSIQLGMEVWAFQFSRDELIFGFPISIKRRVPLRKGEVFSRLGIHPITSFSKDRRLPVYGSSNFNYIQGAVGYEFAYPVKTPIYLEARVLLFALDIPLVGIKAGIHF